MRGEHVWLGKTHARMSQREGSGESTRKPQKAPECPSGPYKNPGINYVGHSEASWGPLKHFGARWGTLGLSGSLWGSRVHPGALCSSLEHSIYVGRLASLYGFELCEMGW